MFKGCLGILIVLLLLLISSGNLHKPIAQSSAPDINATYIERNPVYAYDGSKKWPSEGETVTFKAHIKNRGTTATGTFNYVWKIDGTNLSTGQINSVAPGGEADSSVSWVWQHQLVGDSVKGSHIIEFVADPNNQVVEVSESNNSLRDYTQALSIGFWVEQKVYDYFNQNQFSYCYETDCDGSNSWEDWAQRQVALFNRLLATSVSTEYPQGAIDRVRLQKVVVVPNCTIPIDNAPTGWGNPDKSVDLVWGFTSSKVEPVPGCQRDQDDGNKRLYINNRHFLNLEYPLIHELSHARYLVDLYGLDVQKDNVNVTENGVKITDTPFMPVIRWDVLYYNKAGDTLMGGGWDWGKGYDPHSVGALNRVAGLRARGGNYNSPSVIGEYLNDLPHVMKFRFLTLGGRPIPNASIQIFQAKPFPNRWYGKSYANPANINGTTDSNGIFSYTGNAFGSSMVNGYGYSNLVLLYRIQAGTNVAYGFQEVTDFNIFYWKGQTSEATVPVTTKISDSVLNTTDINRDGWVNMLDVNLVIKDFGKTGTYFSDVNGDGRVDQNDFNLVKAKFFERL